MIKNAEEMNSLCKMQSLVFRYFFMKFSFPDFPEIQLSKNSTYVTMNY